MSALKFNTFCGVCYANIAHGSGIVLSCGDYLCNNCRNLELETCPICCTTGVKLASLASPPDEVKRNMEDPARHLEQVFNVLKFQLSHYKETLSRASQKLAALHKNDCELRRRIYELEEQIERDGFEAKKKRNTEPLHHRSYSSSPSYSLANSPGMIMRQSSPDGTGGLRWKSGPSRSDTYIRGNCSPQSSNTPTIPSSSRMTASSTPNGRYVGESPRIKPSLHNSMSKFVAPMTPLTGEQASREAFGLHQTRNQFCHTPLPHPSPSPSTSSYVQSLKRCTSVGLSPSVASNSGVPLEKFGSNNLFSISNNKH